MKVARQPPVVTSLRPSNHPYLNGAWTPLHEEVDADDLTVIAGAIPEDIDGVYIRNTENQVHQPLGRHHPFDGDAMIHQIAFHGGRASYRNRFVRTRCFAAEQEAGRSLWGGLADPPGTSLRPGYGAHGGLKDSASTDVVVHAGTLYSTFYQCGEAYALDPLTLADKGVAPWAPIDGVSAHCKVDEATGELLFFNYSKHAPYMHYGVVGPDGKLSSYLPIPLPGPRLPHDMAFSERYSILNDLPVFWDPKLLERGVHAVRFFKDMPSRFGVVPRHGGEVRWFEGKPCYVLHFLNAYEDGDELVLDGYFQEDPVPPPLAGSIDGHVFANAAAIGLPARIGEDIPHGLKAVLGRVGYLVFAMWCLARFRGFKAVITIDGERHAFDASEIRIHNGNYLGGVRVAEEASVESLDLVVQVVTGHSRLALALSWLRSGFGYRPRELETLRGRAIRIETEPSWPVSVDGEISAHTPVDAKVLRQALKVMVPLERHDLD